jgi:hypothetical protein
MLDQRIVREWLTTGAEMGVRVTAPFRLMHPDGEWTDFEALIHDFGSPHGALIVSIEDPERCAIAKTSEYYAEIVVPGANDPFFRESAEFFLTEMRWFGQSEPPDWYEENVG